MKFALIVFVFALFVSSVIGQETSMAEPKIVKIPQATRPKEAGGLTGRVSVVVSIDERGNVTSASDVTGPDWICPSVIRPDVVALRVMAKRAAMDAKFEPALRDGQPVASTMRLNFDFPKINNEKDEGITYSATNAPSDSKRFTVKRAPNADGTIDPKTVGHPIVNGKAVSLPKPPYPPAGRAVRASGVVSVQVVIDADGTVFSAEAVSGHPLLRPAARDAACNAEFTPTRLSGQPVRVTGVITYNFVP